MDLDFEYVIRGMSFTLKRNDLFVKTRRLQFFLHLYIIRCFLVFLAIAISVIFLYLLCLKYSNVQYH